MNNAVNFAIATGRKVTDYLRWEVELSYRKSDVGKITGVFEQQGAKMPVNSHKDEHNLDTKTIAALLNPTRRSRNQIFVHYSPVIPAKAGIQ
uniref:Uncharacterized protein n=1 Tax=Candidatus Kentrum sp. LPFa TaxID=2126335 RepID=A0A450W898_9GAMM|nr:MAG: hypothetical protein BECKLPF1236B_GA0070989_104514 [Candidatus Kentron sp. LPFa]